MRGNLPVVAMVAMLVLTAFASVPVAAAESVTVETQAPTDVTAESATFNGEVTSLEDADNVTVYFRYWIAGSPGTKHRTDKIELAGAESFSIPVSGLQSGTEYVVRAHAETENTSAVGSELNFTTDEAEAVAVETGAATDLTETGATLNGEVTTLTGTDDATVWFEYWEQGDPANNTTVGTQTLTAAGTFNASVSGLADNTTYVFVAHAETDNESDAGAEVTFTTLDRDGPLEAVTLEPSDVTDTSATLNGRLAGMDGEPEADVWFEYWVKGDPANATETTMQNLSAPGEFSASLSDLDNQTTYVYVARAAANGSNVTGDPVEFTPGAADTDELVWDGEGPFGQWVTSWLKNLVPADGQPLGQLVSEIVTANNPGSEHRSDNAKAGGNGQGPSDDVSSAGDKVKSGDKGQSGEKGKPDDAGPPDDKGNPNDDTSTSDSGDGEDGDDDEEDEGNGNGQGNGQGKGK